MASSPPVVTGAPPVAAPAPSAPSRRRWVVPVIAVVVIAVVVVAALAAAGVLHLGSSSSGPATYETFSQALGVARSGASSQAGGPWTAVAGAALVTRLAVTEPFSNVSSLKELANCSLTWFASTPTVIVVPATPTNASTGTSAFWWFAFKNDSSSLLVNMVSAGSATPLFTVSGGECSEFGGDLDAFSSGMPDSPTIVAAVNAAGGSSFLADHANASELWGVTGGFTFDGISTAPEWGVEYTACSATASPTETGAVFNATVNGLTAVVTQNASGTAECALSVSSGATLALPTSMAPDLLRKAI